MRLKRRCPAVDYRATAAIAKGQGFV